LRLELLKIGISDTILFHKPMKKLTVIVTLVFFGAVTSLIRLFVGNVMSVRQILWAEDGLFALCIRNNGILECLSSPYSGSMKSTIPKLLAGLIAPFSVLHWAIVANIVAAITIGVLVCLVFHLLRISGGSKALALALSVTPLVHPSLGVESVNSTANLYIPLTYVVMLVLILPSTKSQLRRPALAALVFAGILTMPPLFFVLLLGFALDKSRIANCKLWLTSGVAGVAALSIELVGTLIDSGQRPMNPSATSLVDYITRIPLKLVESIIGDQPAEDIALLYEPEVFWVGIPATLAVVFLVLVSLRFSERIRTAMGLVASGMLLSIVPSLAYGVIDRYFIWLQLSVAAAAMWLLYASDGWRLTRILLSTAVFVAWLFGGSFPAAESRVSESYSWSFYLSEASMQCRNQAVESVEVLFAPDWPLAEDAKAQASGVHRNHIRCSDLKGFRSSVDSSESSYDD